MFNLSSPYPPGLTPRTWPLFLGAVVVAIAVLLPFDHSLSSLAVHQSSDVLEFFAGVTRWGKSDWLLYPSAALLAVSALAARLIPDRISKLALIEMNDMREAQRSYEANLKVIEVSRGMLQRTIDLLR